MAQLVVAAAGAAIGGLVGGPQGAQIGFALGSYLGASLLAKDIEGPRLQDLSVTISSYGAAIPSVWGGPRVGCVPIWAAPLTETITETSAGKGGPDVQVASYSASFAVSVAEGEIAGIRRIWLDARLVYDASEDASSEAKAASAAFSAFFTFYTGSETQQSDPTIESYEGAENVEAYRGTAYIVFTDLPVGDYGNRLPQVRVETSTEPIAAVEVEELVPYVVNPWALVGGVPEHFGGTTTYDSLILSNKADNTTTAIGGTYTTLSDAFAAAATALGVAQPFVMTWSNSMNVTPNAFSAGAQITDGAEYVYIYVGISPISYVLDYPPQGQSRFGSSFFAGGVIPEVSENYDKAGTASVLREVWIDAQTFVPAWQGYGVMRLVQSTGVVAPPVGYFSVNTALEYGPTAPAPSYFPTVVSSLAVVIRAKRDPLLPAQACEIGDPVALGIAQIPNNPTQCITSTGDVSPNYTYTPETGTFKQLTEIDYAGGELETNGVGPVLRTTDPNYSSQTYWEAAAADAGVSGTYGVDYPVVVTDIGVGAYDTDEVPAGSVLLSTIVSDICQDGGLTPGQIDVSALTDTVLGYVRGRTMPARAALEPLRRAYYFDAVESGDLVRFVKRGASAIVTLDADDLGAGPEAAGELLEHDRGQQAELPSTVEVAYQAIEADFQIGVQQSLRRAGESLQVAQVELPIVLENLKAAQVADVLLYDAWASRNTRRAAVTRAHAYIEPTDVINLDDGDQIYRVRVVDKVEDGGVIRLECRDDDASIYSPNSTAGDIAGGGAGLSYGLPTNLQLLDLPILRDSDDATAAGHYIAASGFGTTWSGARAFRSTDDGANYSAIIDLGSAAVIGFTETVMPDWTGGNIVDELSTVNVTLHSGTLSTITLTELLAGGNFAAIGDEVIQFQRATIVSGTTYRLTGMLRARFGTEQHTGSHAVNERFVLLSAANVLRQSAAVSEGGVAAVWKGVTFGTSLADAFEVDFTNNQAGAKPLAPIHLGIGFVGGSPGEWLVQWTRRTRLQAPWQDYIDAPLGEASEQYLVEVLNAGDVVSSQTVTTTSATVSATEGQVVQVRQISASVGPGFPATIVIT